MGEVSTIGLDIAKSVFQVHGVDAAGQVVIAAMPGGHRSLCLIASLVARAQGARSHGKADAAGLREALRQTAEE
jgi:transposase